MDHDKLTSVWRALEARATQTRAVTLRALREADPARGSRFAREAVGLYLDFSRQRVDDDVMRMLVEVDVPRVLGDRPDGVVARLAVEVDPHRVMRVR